MAAGRGSGGREFDIVPGQPDQSIIMFRMTSVDPGIMMPELGKRLIHTEGVELIREWIAALPAGKPAASGISITGRSEPRLATYAETLARARQLLSAGQLPAAEKVYQQLLEAAPQAPEPWHEMGVLQLQAKRAEVALECLQRAVALMPGNLRFQTNLGLAERAMRQFPEAIASFRRALELGPPSAELYNNLAFAPERRRPAGRRIA